MDIKEQSAWLLGPEAEAFMEGREKVIFFGRREVELSQCILGVLRQLQKHSVNSSAQACHSAKPIQVTYALENLPSIRKGVHDLFKLCFGMAAMDMVKKNEQHELNKEFRLKVSWENPKNLTSFYRLLEALQIFGIDSLVTTSYRLI